MEETLDPRPRPGGSSDRAVPTPRTSTAISRASSRISWWRVKKPDSPRPSMSRSSSSRRPTASSRRLCPGG